MTEDEIEEEQWVFTEESLQRARESASDLAARVLRSAAAANMLSPGSLSSEATGKLVRDPPRPLSLDEASRYVYFYAQKVPELCDLCGAPSEVRWTAMVFYRRFYAVRSPMEFGPLHMMFACVHVACKIEEYHEITLDKLLEAADAGFEDSLRDRIRSLELPLLEGIGFALLVEPKPDTALRMLAEELQSLFAQGLARDRVAEQAIDSPPARGCGGLTEVGLNAVVSHAEKIVLDLAVKTDAILLWPMSIVIAAALSAALDMYSPDPSEAGRQQNAQPLSEVLCSLLDSTFESEKQRSSIRGMVHDVRHSIEIMSQTKSDLTEASMIDTAKQARRCLRAFERIREDATERHEAHRRERKRRWCEMKSSIKAVPTPQCDFSELSRRALAIRGSPSPTFHSDTDGFVLHRACLDQEEEDGMDD